MNRAAAPLTLGMLKWLEAVGTRATDGRWYVVMNNTDTGEAVTEDGNPAPTQIAYLATTDQAVRPQIPRVVVDYKPTLNMATGTGDAKFIATSRNCWNALVNVAARAHRYLNADPWEQAAEGTEGLVTALAELAFVVAAQSDEPMPPDRTPVVPKKAVDLADRLRYQNPNAEIERLYSLLEGIDELLSDMTKPTPLANVTAMVRAIGYAKDRDGVILPDGVAAEARAARDRYVDEWRPRHSR